MRRPTTDHSDRTGLLTPVPARRILGMRVHATSYGHAAREILRWAREGESRYVCVATVNNVIEAYDDPDYAGVMEAADLVTPDGMPLVWGLRLLGGDTATRVYGPDLTPVVCRLAAERGVPVGFYGGAEEVLDDLTVELGRAVSGAAGRVPRQPTVSAADPRGGAANPRGSGPVRRPLPGRQEAAGARAAAAGRRGMAVPSRAGAPPALAAIPVSEPPLRPLRRTAPERATPPAEPWTAIDLDS
jgi:Glycosyl transferase WecG/TagA/CpsF family